MAKKANTKKVKKDTKKEGKQNTYIPRYRDGALVTWNSVSRAAMDPSDVRDMALAAGLPESIVPEYPGDRRVLSRVIDQSASKLRCKGWVLSKLKRSGGHVLLTIHDERKEVENRKAELPQVGILEWFSAPPDNQNTIRGDHEVADFINDAYQRLLGKITGPDWSITLVQYLTTELSAVAWRDDGRVYWVPPLQMEQLRELQSWLKNVGINLAILEIDAEIKESVTEVVTESLADQLDTFVAEVEKFDGKQKPSTYIDRLERFHELRKKAIVWGETIGVAKNIIDGAMSTLDKLEDDVDVMLEKRQKIRVKRDGTIEVLS